MQHYEVFHPNPRSDGIATTLPLSSHPTSFQGCGGREWDVLSLWRQHQDIAQSFKSQYLDHMPGKHERLKENQDFLFESMWAKSLVITLYPLLKSGHRCQVFIVCSGIYCSHGNYLFHIISCTSLLYITVHHCLFYPELQDFVLNSTALLTEVPMSTEWKCFPLSEAHAVQPFT